MDFKEIDYAVMEATMNVVASKARYRNKQHLIEDINNDAWISEEEYYELSNIDDEVVTEAAIYIDGEKYDIDEKEYLAYRLDPWTHNYDVARYNRKVAELAVAVYQASHKAKGTDGMPLRNLISTRSKKIEAIAQRKYAGKHEALCDLVKLVRAAKNNCFMTIKSIVGLGNVRNKKQEIDPELVWVSFFARLPKAPLTSYGYILCKVQAEYNKLNEKVKRLSQESALMYKDKINAYLSKIHDLEDIVAKELKGYFTKNYCNDVCFFNSSGLKTYEFAEHMRRSSINSQDVNTTIEEISAMQTTTEEYMTTSNNRACIALIAMVYGFNLK